MSGLLFIRHAETDMAGRFCGHSDPPVNARGEQQIRGLIEAIEPASIRAIFCSDLQRATFTADALARAFAVPVISTSSLREINFGDWEGLSWGEIELRDAAYANDWVKGFPALPAPGGESFEDFEARVSNKLDELLRSAEDGRVAVVTHGGVMRVALQRFTGCGEQDAWNHTKGYCSSFVYEKAADLQQVSL